MDILKSNKDKMDRFKVENKSTDPNYILNPESGRYVLKTGKIGKNVSRENSDSNFSTLPEHVLISVLNGLNIVDLVNTCKVDKKAKKICKENNKIRNRVQGYLLLEKDIDKFSQIKKDKFLIKNSKNLEIVKFLIENGANVHVNNNEVLKKASENGHLEVVKFLVQNGADVDANNGLPLILASQNGHLEVVEYLVSKDANIHIRNDLALSWASERGHLEVVKFLVKNGANVHAYDDYALRETSRYGYLEVVKFLVKNGANVNANNNEALRLASRNGKLEIVNYLRSKM